jgi:NTE family protein
MRERALVLSGGGVTGIAWELGMIAGLRDAGVDLGSADVVIGTSAGSVVGAQITSGASLEELYERQIAPPDGEIASSLSRSTMLTLVGSVVMARDVLAARRRIGRMALAANTVPEEQRIKVIRSRLPRHEWPGDRRLLVTAVDTATGELGVFGRDGGVALVDAVAASCAVPGVWPPVTIAGRRWMDGGIRSMANADLAHGYRRVVVLAPLRMNTALMPGPQQQAAQLRSKGADVVVVQPDASTREAFGRNPLDPAYRAPSARAGRLQAGSVATQVRAVWDPSH